MSFVKVLISVPDSEATINSQYLQLNVPAQQGSYNGLENMIAAMIEGSQIAYSKLSAGLLQASGTVTLSSLVATDTVTVNGVVFTAVASGATGNQFNVGGSDTITATNLAVAINASVTAKVVNVVTASASGPVVTVTAVQPGLQGNMNTLAISAHGSVSGAFLTGGTDGDQVATNFGAAS
jgi:phage tail sheath gpL-like